jgi:MraZ protein
MTPAWIHHDPRRCVNQSGLNTQSPTTSGGPLWRLPQISHRIRVRLTRFFPPFYSPRGSKWDLVVILGSLPNTTPEAVMLMGQHHVLMDEKGRVAFPAALRALIDSTTGTDDGGRFVLTQSLYDPCLVGQTEAAFAEKAAKIRALPPSNPAVSLYKRFVIATACIVTVDKVGRVGVPKEQREYAGLERECIWLGIEDSVELWNRARYDDLRRATSTVDLAAARDFLGGHGL